MKNLLTLIILIVLSASCQQTPDNWNSCDRDSDCKPGVLCLRGQCHSDPCNSINCGKGECIPASMKNMEKYDFKENKLYICECAEDAVLIPERSICVPTCDGYSEECTEFGKTTDFKQCNMSAGRCGISCQGEGSCKEGWYCSTGGACRKRDN